MTKEVLFLVQRIIDIDTEDELRTSQAVAWQCKVQELRQNLS